MAATRSLEAEEARSPEIESAPPEAVPRVVRVTVNLPRETAEVLKGLAARRGVTVTEALRLAIATENVLAEATDQGKKVLLHDEKKNKTQELILR